jgi:hypothetical protein
MAGMSTPLHPMGVAEILDQAVRLVRRNARAAFSVAVPLALVRTAVAALVSYAGFTASTSTQLTLVGGLVVTGAFGMVLTGLLAPVFAGDLTGRRVGAGEALKRIGGGVFGLLAVALIATVAQGVGLGLLVVGGVWLWGAWAVAAPARVLEGAGVFQSLGRSNTLVQTQFWRVWGIRALGWLLTYVLTLFVSLPFVLAAVLVTNDNPFKMAGMIGSPGLYVTITSIGTLLGAAATSPITSAIDFLLYTDLRMRREGMDIVLALPAMSTW